MVNFDKILSDRETPSCIKSIVQDALKKQGVVTVGSVLQEMSTFDIVGMIESAIVLTDTLIDDKGVGAVSQSSITSYMMFTSLMGFLEGGDFALTPMEIIPQMQYLKLLMSMELAARNYKQIHLDYPRMTVLTPVDKKAPPLVKFEEGADIPDLVVKNLTEIDLLLREKFVYTKKEIEQMKEKGEDPFAKFDGDHQFFFKNTSTIKESLSQGGDSPTEQRTNKNVESKADTPAEKVKKQEPPPSLEDWLS